jgi:hypothetical protein
MSLVGRNKPVEKDPNGCTVVPRVFIPVVIVEIIIIIITLNIHKLELLYSPEETDKPTVR